MIKEFVHLTNMFENMGFVYLGPVDGHNMEELDKVLQTAKTYHHPVFIHVNTVKGKGYKFAQENPGEYHGVACFNPKVGTKETWKKECFSCAFGDILVKFSKSDKNICAITAAMKYGVGLQSFCREFPSRFFDVGIAEQHAVTFAAALAKSGKTPVFAVYASFLQRAYDQLIHDVTLQNLHIVLAVDRFGVVGSDGETHQGTFIMNMLMGIPNVTIFTPCNYQELEEHLYKAIYEVKGIAAVCYPRGKEQLITPLPTDKNEDTAVITYGRMYTELSQRMNNVYTCHDILYPVQESFITQFLSKKHILFIEEMYETGGYGDYFHLQLIHRGYTGTFRKKALPAIIKQAPPSFIFSSLLDTGTAVIEVP
ncbi:MAG: 1-deoxy-D-xylulose-5-phosphate synthase, partial [Oscillospiraceae bacterium]|jgi:1-deoxy-D-xylulose-5-phosphate synthase|nr:1-deoxy-D-xylulose-5-phosphate synthase [Oscillospiraceae bacterium]